MDFEAAFEKAMNKLENREKIRRQIIKIGCRPKKIRRDSFIKHLERIKRSLQRRNISQEEAVKILRRMLG